MTPPTTSATTSAAECPECAAKVRPARNPLRGEVLRCPDCSAELEVTSVSPCGWNSRRPLRKTVASDPPVAGTDTKPDLRRRTTMRIGLLHSRVRVEERLLIEEFQCRDIELELLDVRSLTWDLDDADSWTRFDVVVDRCISQTQAAAAISATPGRPSRSAVRSRASWPYSSHKRPSPRHARRRRARRPRLTRHRVHAARGRAVRQHLLHDGAENPAGDDARHARADYLELNSPAASPRSREDCETIAALGLRPRVLTHTRCHHNDVRLAIQTGVAGVEVRFNTEGSFRIELSDLLRVYKAVHAGAAALPLTEPVPV